MKHPALKYLAWLAVACIAAWLPLKAHAYDGIVAADVSLRAGPDPDYPAVALLPAGMPVSIEGCVTGWTWCDVVAGPDRGWVAGTYLQETWDDQPVFIADYGAQIGIPIVAFTLGVYWDDYYRGRPWFAERGRWEHRHFAYRAPPRPHGFYQGGAYHGQAAHGGGNHNDRRGSAHGPGEQHYAHTTRYGNPPPQRPLAHQQAPNGPRGPAAHAMPNASHAPVAHNAPHAPANNGAHRAPQRPAGHPQAPPKREHGDDHHDH